MGFSGGIKSKGFNQQRQIMDRYNNSIVQGKSDDSIYGSFHDAKMVLSQDTADKILAINEN
jgi:hypothetical protein